MAVPFHMGTPDAYEGAPLIITMFLNIFPKIPLLSSYAYIYNTCFKSYLTHINNIILLIAILSII